VTNQDVVRAHVADEYRGVFDDAMVESFVQTCVGLELAQAQAQRVVDASPSARKVLDVGAGYGSFVLACRQRGLDAVGVEPQQFELAFARRRLAEVRPHDLASDVYVDGDGRVLPFADASFDVVTLWNVAEHVRELQRLIDEVARVLVSGGVAFVLCPNYAAIRREAHYQVPWAPMPRRLASWYLRRLGRTTRFFDDDIHYRTPWQLASALRSAGLDPRPAAPASLEKVRNVQSINRALPRWMVGTAVRLGLGGAVAAVIRALQRNPMRRTIDLVAVKR